MADPLLIAKGNAECYMLPRMANRHGVITGATGTGKTVTLQSLAQSFSRIGVPVFMADVKGDLSGICLPGSAANPKVAARIEQLRLKEDWSWEGCPTAFWDVWGEQGHPLRATVSAMGPVLLSRILNLNDTQEGVLNIIFKYADDNGLLLLDLKDLRAMAQYVGDNAAEMKTKYGNVAAASIGAIQRGLLVLEQQGAEKFFGEPALDLEDLIQTDGSGRGVVNILAADKLLQSPQLYSTFLLWLMSELFEQLPEVGDLDKPKLLFFFDEAHLLFNDAPKELLDKVTQVVRLIRSKGVGVYFVTQNPIDIPDVVLGQMGNRVQHALRAFTPRDQKAVRAAAETFRQNPGIDIAGTVTELGVGEALVSFLDDKGMPAMVERAFVVPPRSQVGPITEDQRKKIVTSSPLFGHYEKVLDRESAFEVLRGRADASSETGAKAAPADAAQKQADFEGRLQAQRDAAAAQAQAKLDAAAARQRPQQTTISVLAEAAAKSAVRAASSSIGRQIVRGILGSLLGGGGSPRSSRY
jgi:DNA helicase HerA-like ATPase